MKTKRSGSKSGSGSDSAAAAQAAVEADFTELPDLASEALGGAAILCNDEFFADKENLLRARDAEWREHEYTDRGKWMDGWETRRRREAGYDWCVIRLGVPGQVRGFIVDTSYFRGNFPEACSIEGAELDTSLDLAALGGATWHPLVPETKLAGHTKNRIEVAAPRRVTHLRLNIFPDGGVARLRAHGVVVPDWQRLLALGGPIDLAAIEHGAQVLACSDMFFGSRGNLIKPGRPFNMSDGWETKRRRGPGHDWSLIKLGAAGGVERLEIDTTHFKGNAPGRGLVEVCHAPGATTLALTSNKVAWRPLLDTRLQPHTRHLFDGELRRTGSATHLRLSVFPDGGVARLRAWGYPDLAVPFGLEVLNALRAEEAAAELLRACGSPRWASAMSAMRPFHDLPSLLRMADRTWWGLDHSEWLRAFAAHPKIGQKGSSAWSQREQSGAAKAAAKTKAALAKANAAYEKKFGFIFIVCATGKSAEEMLALCEARLAGSRAGELRTAAEEQAKITRLRLSTWLEEHAP